MTGVLSAEAAMAIVAFAIFTAIGLFLRKHRQKAHAALDAAPPVTYDQPLPDSPEPSELRYRSSVKRSGKNRVTTEIFVGPVEGDVAIGAHGFLERLWGLGQTQDPRPDVVVGDPAFDGEIVIKGSEVTVLALLSPDVRRLIRRVVSRGWLLVDNTWQLEANGRIDPRADGHFDAGGEVARAMRKNLGDPVRRLFARATSDPLPGVRCRALGLLIDHFPETPEANQAIAHLSTDRDLATRLRIARTLADLATLVEILLLLPDQSSFDPLPPAQLIELKVTALESLVDLAPDDPRTVELVDAFARPQPGQVHALNRAAIESLALVPHPDREALLLEALDAPSEMLQLAGINALHSVGTVAAVPELARFRDRLLGSKTKTAAAAAIVAIQFRAGAVDGGLAIAEAGGQLAMHPDAAD